MEGLEPEFLRECMGTCMASATCAFRAGWSGGVAEIPRAAGAIKIGSVGQTTPDYLKHNNVHECAGGIPTAIRKQKTWTRRY